MADNYLERQHEEYELRKQAAARKKAREWKKRLALYAAKQKQTKSGNDE